jgi:hypothetical protein
MTYKIFEASRKVKHQSDIEKYLLKNARKKILHPFGDTTEHTLGRTSNNIYKNNVYQCHN